LAMSV